MTHEATQELGTESVLWRLTDLYQDTTDSTIEEEINLCQIEAERINEQYSGKVSVLDAGELYLLVHDLEALSLIKGRISTFAFLNFTTKTMDAKAGAFVQKVRELGSKLSKKTVFFELEWNQVKEDEAKKILDHPKIAPYRHYLETMRRYAFHLLSSMEERLLIEIAPVGRGAWTLLFEKIMGQLSFGSSKRTEEEVLADLYSPDREVRKQAATDLTEGLASQIHILTHLNNVLLADKMLDDGMRNYPNWISSMNLYNEISDATVDTLINTVISRYDIPQRYYHLKKKFLGYEVLMDYDRYAPLPDLENRIIPWSECQEIVLQSFNAFSTKMAEIAELFFTKEWIHAPIVTGKRGGAFAHPCTPDVHPYVMVNYTGNIRDVSTVAHELGHGVHQYLAAKQGYYNSDTPLVLAETASVFAELLVFNYQLNRMEDENERTAFISQKLESIFATVFRQVSMNRFENLSHTNRRDQGELSTEKLSKLWISTQEEMFGDSVTLSKNYEIWWSYIPHFLSSPGYVYSYAFGELLVLSLYQRYLKEGETFVAKYINLLSAGGNDSPVALLKPFDMDLNDPGFWNEGLSLIDTMLKKIE